jgi:hypothetical protein
MPDTKKKKKEKKREKRPTPTGSVAGLPLLPLPKIGTPVLSDLALNVLVMFMFSVGTLFLPSLFYFASRLHPTLTPYSPQITDRDAVMKFHCLNLTLFSFLSLKESRTVGEASVAT